MYLTLRIGPWSIERRDRLDRLRDIAQRETAESERRIEFVMRQWERKKSGPPAMVDATIRNPLIDQVDVNALQALDALDAAVDLGADGPLERPLDPRVDPTEPADEPHDEDGARGVEEHSEQ